jgi:hypothetical protein
VFLNTDEHAATYSYSPPNISTPQNVTWIWDLREPTEDKANGLEIVHTATLIVAASATFAREGVLTVNSEPWVVTEVGHNNVGMRTIVFRRENKVRTSASGRKYGQ